MVAEPQTPPVVRWSGVRRLLVVRLDNLGDVLMATPAIAALRESMPSARITLLASPAGAAALPHLADVSDAMSFVAPWMKAAADDAPATLGHAEAELVARLAAEDFDAAVVFTTCTQSALPAALVCRMAGIPRRLAHVRENPYGLLTDWVEDADVVGDGMRHEVARQLALVGRIGCRVGDPRLRFAVRPVDRDGLARRMAAIGMRPGTPYVVVHPGASAPSRRYPAERFGIAAGALARSSGCAVVFSGGADESALIEDARRAMGRPAQSLAGLLSLGELGALVEGAGLLIANNSGPAHLAAALGTPVVDLYAQTNPQHTPWRVPSRVLSHDVPCRHCLKSRCPQGHHDCLRRVEPAAVARAGLELLVAGRGDGSPLPHRRRSILESHP